MTVSEMFYILQTKTMSVLAINNLYKSYSGVQALSNISFSLEKGQMMAILGETGSGKTTLLKLIAGLMDADNGSVLFRNKKITKGDKLIAGEKGIEVIFQDFELFANHTVEENIEHKVRHLTPTVKSERLSYLIDILELSELLPKLPRELSGGQKQKVAIARALSTLPSLLLMDEPYSNLDSISKNELRADIRSVLKRVNASAIMVTHDATDALSFADYIMVMKRGSLVQFDKPENIYNTPASAYVARFAGDPNIFTAYKWNTLLPGIEPNAKLQYMLRAEHITISTTTKPKSVPATILFTEYRGHFTKYTCKTQSGLKLITYSTERLAKETEVYLQLNTDKMYLLPRK